MRKCHRLGVLNHPAIFMILEIGKCKINVPDHLVTSEDTLFESQPVISLVGKKRAVGEGEDSVVSSYKVLSSL